MTWPINAMNGAIPVVWGQDANTFPVRTSRAASSARAPARSYSCSTRTGRPGPGGPVAWQRPRGGGGRGPGRATPRAPPGGGAPRGRPAGGGARRPPGAGAGDPPPPLADRVCTDVQVRRDPGTGPATGSSQHDLRPQPVPVGGLGPAGTFL